MNSKMKHASRAELAAVTRDPYTAAKGKQKRKLLDEFIAMTGYHEKSATRVPSAPAATPVTAKRPEKPKLVYAKPGQARVQALRMVWPIVCRRLEGAPDINAMQLFEELCLRR